VSRDLITGALVERLQSASAASAEDIEAIRTLPIAVKRVEPQHFVVREGQKPTQCCLLASGFCVRAKTTGEGKRQILSIHIPGEIPDLQSLHLVVMDHDLLTLTPATLGFIEHKTLRELFRRRPAIVDLFWRDTLIDAAMFREWIVNVGQRPAPSRLAHVVVELRERLKAIKQIEGNSFEMPLTQEQLGEALGITAVHANRVIQQLRQEGLLEFLRGRVTILNEAGLLKLADFDSRYLHQSPTM
jgi:CRP-like cAMP-binding protein